MPNFILIKTQPVYPTETVKSIGILVGGQHGLQCQSGCLFLLPFGYAQFQVCRKFHLCIFRPALCSRDYAVSVMEYT